MRGRVKIVVYNINLEEKGEAKSWEPSLRTKNKAEISSDIIVQPTSLDKAWISPEEFAPPVTPFFPGLDPGWT